MFCSSRCKEHVLERFSYECGVASRFPLENLSDMFPFIHRMVSDSLETFGGIEKLKAIVAKTDRQTIFDFDISNEANPETQKNLIISLISLYHQQDEEQPISITKQKVTDQLSRNHIKHLKYPITPEGEKFLLKFYQRMSTIYELCASKMVYYGKWDGDNFSRKQRFASALFLLGALFNHSCDPNVHTICLDDKFVYVTTRPIRAGEQLFYTYR